MFKGWTGDELLDKVHTYGHLGKHSELVHIPHFILKILANITDCTWNGGHGRNHIQLRTILARLSIGAIHCIDSRRSLQGNFIIHKF